MIVDVEQVGSTAFMVERVVLNALAKYMRLCRLMIRAFGD